MIILIGIIAIIVICFLVISGKQNNEPQTKREHTETSSNKQPKDNKFDPEIILSSDTPLHPHNDDHNFSGYIKKINWNDTRDGQKQCWLTIVDAEQAKDMSKYIRRDQKGILQQYEELAVMDYIHVEYFHRNGYNNIKNMTILKKKLGD